jgi:hypothetical protein
MSHEYSLAITSAGKIRKASQSSRKSNTKPSLAVGSVAQRDAGAFNFRVSKVLYFFVCPHIILSLFLNYFYSLFELHLIIWFLVFKKLSCIFYDLFYH